MRLLIIGTHPHQTTGYSKVVYNIAKCLGSEKNIQCSIFGIQKFTKENDKNREDLPSNVFAWDVFEDDKEDFGFGTQTLRKFVSINHPDVVIVYNDPIVVQKYIMNLVLIPNRKFKIVVYLDQLYNYQDKEILKYICTNSDYIFCFTDYWKKNMLSYIEDKELHERVSNNSSIVKHGIDERFKKMDTNQAKFLLNFTPNDFIFLNLNRVQGRKRPDVCIMAFVKFLKKTNAKNAYLFMPNIRDNKLDVIKILDHNLRLNGLSPEYKNNLRLVSPITKVLTDDEINVVYNACDVGINTCEAEGFGLCNYEHASLGKPQILSNVGGLTDFFNKDNSLVIEPKITIYTDNGGDIFGDSQIVDVDDVSDAMVKYYTSKRLREEHGKKCEEIKEKYVWKKEVSNMISVLKKLPK